MDVDDLSLCRTCGKKSYIFCDVYHEVVQKLMKLVPDLLDLNVDLKKDVCINCFQMIKTLVFNIEEIKDMQKILLIQRTPKTLTKFQSSSEVTPERKRSIVEDITKKYSNIKVRKISVNSPEKPPTKPPEQTRTITKILQSTKLIAPKVQVQKTQSVKVELSKTPEPSHRSFMCISCSEKFQKFSQLEVHLKTCKTSTTQQFKCFCGKTLSSKQELSRHVSEKHKQNKRHICTVCQKVVTSLSNLQNHMMIAHKSPHGNLKGIYVCHVCKSKHSDLQSLKNHRLVCKEKQNES